MSVAFALIVVVNLLSVRMIVSVGVFVCVRVLMTVVMFMLALLQENFSRQIFFAIYVNIYFGR